ncbi:MAG: serpin family protein [Chloroflexota bacterium]|nr:serpin family protein [Chloroflexota bacterium]
MKAIPIVILLLSLILNTACVPEEKPVITETPPLNVENPADSGYVQSSLAREIEPQVKPDVMASLVDGNTDFAFSFYEQIRQGEGNIIFSPLSLSLALSMTLTGAETSTEQGMLQALQFSLPEEDVHSAFNALLLAIEASQEQTSQDSEGNNFQLNIANSLWGQAGYDFKKTFLDTIALNYGAGVYNVDYANNPEFARNAINDWVEEETEDKIKDLIPEGAINPLTRLVLANAIYFNGSWYHPFSESDTSQVPFKLLDGSEITVEMMKLSGQILTYNRGENYQAVDLPYLSPDFAMTILLPNSGTFTDFESGLDSQKLSLILDEMHNEPVNLQMPKFDFITATDAKEPLVNLGMAEAFDMGLADFSGITEADTLYITDVLHKAAITVDETGTEAAAATVVIVGLKGMPSEPISMIIDRPFMYLIRHIPTGSILFMGRVTNP